MLGTIQSQIVSAGRVKACKTSQAYQQLVVTERNAEKSPVISKIIHPVHAQYRADKTNSLDEEKKVDRGRERQFAAHLKGAIKILENYQQEQYRGKLFLSAWSEFMGTQIAALK